MTKVPLCPGVHEVAVEAAQGAEAGGEEVVLRALSRVRPRISWLCQRGYARPFGLPRIESINQGPERYYRHLLYKLKLYKLDSNRSAKISVFIASSKSGKAERATTVIITTTYLPLKSK